MVRTLTFLLAFAAAFLANAASAANNDDRGDRGDRGDRDDLLTRWELTGLDDERRRIYPETPLRP